jgi:hypothetical protein
VRSLLLFSSKCCVFCNANFFGSCVIHILYTGRAKIKMSNSGNKRLIIISEMSRRSCQNTSNFEACSFVRLLTVYPTLKVVDHSLSAFGKRLLGISAYIPSLCKNYRSAVSTTWLVLEQPNVGQEKETFLVPTASISSLGRTQPPIH